MLRYMLLYIHLSAEIPVTKGVKTNILSIVDFKMVSFTLAGI